MGRRKWPSVLFRLAPPANAKNTESLNQRLPVSGTEGTSDSQSYAEKEEQFQERQKERAAAKAEAKEKEEKVALQKQNCEKARADLQTVNNPPGGRLREVNSEGVLVYMTEEQINLRRTQALEAVTEWCNG